VVFHLANGLWSFAVSWGIVQSPRSQLIVTYVSVWIFVVVNYIGICSIIQFAFIASVIIFVEGVTRMSNRIRAVVGSGLAGLMATIKAAEAGVPVDLFSIVPVKRSHSVCAQGGINGAVNTKGEGDSPWKHFDDTVYGGDFLANQPPVKAMCDAAPQIINLMDRMG